MAYLVSDVIRVVEELAPLGLAESWDNCGLLIGSEKNLVSRVCLALDLDEELIDRAVAAGAEMIIVHHPPIFGGINHLNEAVPEMRNFANIIRAGISVYAAHTNLDSAIGGVNECLAEVLGLEVTGTLFPSERQLGRFADDHHTAGLVRITELPDAIDFRSFLVRVNQHLQTSGCFMSGVSDCEIKRVLVSGGAYDDNWTDPIARSGCDCFVGGEIKHHQLMALEARGVRALAAGHDCTERPVLIPLAAYLEAELPGLLCSAYTGLDYNVLMN